MNYRIVTSTDPAAMEAGVNALLAQGWQLVGGLVVYSGMNGQNWFAQALQLVPYCIQPYFPYPAPAYPPPPYIGDPPFTTGPTCGATGGPVVTTKDPGNPDVTGIGSIHPPLPHFE